MAYKKDVFLLHLDGAPQAVAAAVTTATWNKLCSEIQCSNTNNATITLVDAELPGTVLSVRKITGAGTVAIDYPSGTTLATLTGNVNDTAVFVWSGSTWDIVALDITPSAISSASISTTGNASIAGTLGVTSTSTFTGAATFNGGATIGVGSLAITNKGAVIQATSRSETVSSNAMVGTITTHSAQLTAGTEASFTFNNNFIGTANSKIFLTLAGANAASFGGLGVSGVGTGTCTIRYKNDTAAAVSSTVDINFLVIN